MKALRTTASETAKRDRRTAAPFDVARILVTDTGTDAAAELVRQLSTHIARDDFEAVVNVLSDALDLAKSQMHEASRGHAPFDDPREPDYWLG